MIRRVSRIRMDGGRVSSRPSNGIGHSLNISRRVCASRSLRCILNASLNLIIRIRSRIRTRISMVGVCVAAIVLVSISIILIIILNNMTHIHTRDIFRLNHRNHAQLDIYIYTHTSTPNP